MKRERVFSNLIWRFFERVGAQGVTFIVSIILARLLDPKSYGMIAMVTIFTSVLQVFIDGGLGRALVQKKNSDNLDFSTVFWFNIFFSITLYLIMFFLAPFISLFFDMPDLTPVFRIQCLIIVLSSLKSVQQAYISKNMIFKKFFFATLGGTIGAAVVGIGLAYFKFGVWALVAQYLFNQIIDTIILWITVEWRPVLKFSLTRLKSLYSFGWKLLIAGLMDVGYRNLRSLLIGKVYSTVDLAYYNRAQQFPTFIVTNINSSIDSVLLPAMSTEQDAPGTVKAMLRRSIRVSTYIMAPMMMGLFACAELIVSIILTDKWLPCVPFLRIICIAYMFLPIHSANLNAINAVGRSDIFLKLEIIKKIIELIVLVIAVQFNVYAIAISLLIVEIPNQVINSWPNKKLLNYTLLD